MNKYLETKDLLIYFIKRTLNKLDSNPEQYLDGDKVYLIKDVPYSEERAQRLTTIINITTRFSPTDILTKEVSDYLTSLIVENNEVRYFFTLLYTLAFPVLFPDPEDKYKFVHSVISPLYKTYQGDKKNKDLLKPLIPIELFKEGFEGFEEDLVINSIAKDNLRLLVFCLGYYLSIEDFY